MEASRIKDRVRFVVAALEMAGTEAKQQAEQADTEVEAAIYRAVAHVWSGATEAVRYILEDDDGQAP